MHLQICQDLLTEREKGDGEWSALFVWSPKLLTKRTEMEDPIL